MKLTRIRIPEASEFIENDAPTYVEGYEEGAQAQLEADQNALNITVRKIDRALGEFSDSEDYDLVSEYWQRKLYNVKQALKQGGLNEVK